MSWEVDSEKTYHIKFRKRLFHVIDRELSHNEICPAPPRRLIFTLPCKCKKQIKETPTSRLPKLVKKLVTQWRRWGTEQKEATFWWKCGKWQQH